MICPICGSGRNKFFCAPNGFDIYDCQNCGVGFVWPIAGDSADIYRAEYFNGGLADNRNNKFGYVDYEEDKRAMAGTFLTYLERVARYIVAGRMIDIGTATGYFLDLAKAKGWLTGGVEISAYAAAIARDKGHKMFLGDVGDLAACEQYDVVTMWDVLEHLPNPKKYLEDVNKILILGGLVAINTIDRGSWWAKLLGQRWQAIAPPEHLFYFSAGSLKILLEQNGFEIVEQSKIGKKFTLAYICKILANRYNLGFLLPAMKFLNNGYWRKISLPINLRDNIFIIARKVG
ncbi:MAG: Methyltransferase type 11 [Parcubacteria group bacterium GW2011_GWA2_43_9b]|nr:MAG: Methyltransferase type 11 [Parcubacteria group bacterium GW2011_GWA2_43_9b]